MSVDPDGMLMTAGPMVLFRQIHPGKMKADGPGKSNFIPEDKIALSTRREEMGAQVAYEAHISLGRESAGTWGISVEEVYNNGLKAFDDEHLADMPKFHVSVHFPECGTGQRERYAAKLHAAAKERGWLYQPPTSAGGGTMTVTLTLPT